MMRSVRMMTIFLSAFLIVFALANCADLMTSKKSRYRSSVVEYLYPKQDVRVSPSVPRLALPLRVGIAFVPDSGITSARHLDEAQKMELMDRIAKEFRKLEFIKDIEIIPPAYLIPAGSFSNLDQIKTMYGVDVIALLSYDQVQHTDEGFLSVMYWTIVGAYIVKGEKNDTSTMVDAAVYDIASRKMLFRSPGVSRVKGSATIVNLSEQLRLNSKEGFQLAADNLVVNLQSELARFKTKVKEKPEEYIVQHRSGYTGGGSLGGLFTILILSLAGLAVWRSRA